MKKKITNWLPMKWQRTTRVLMASGLMAMVSTATFAQTTIISPTGAGGFELGSDFVSNGWTVENYTTTNTNKWFVGTASTPSAGTNAAYISNDAAGATYNYLNTGTSRVMFWRDVTFPVGESNITLSLKVKVAGEASYDDLSVFVQNSATVPAVTQPSSSSTSSPSITGTTRLATLSEIGSTYAVRTYTISAADAGNATVATTRRIIFYWENDGSGGTQPPASIDEISLVSAPPPPPPSNNEAAGSISLSVNPDLGCGLITTGTTVSATASTDAAATCAGANDDVWYSFVATAISHRVSFTGTSNTMVAALYTGTIGSLTFVTEACASTTLNATGLSVGTTYYVRAYTSSTTATTNSAFSICVGTPLPPPANDDLCGAISLTPTTICSYNTYSTTSATSTTGVPAPGCASYAGGDVWFSVVVPANGHLKLDAQTGGITDGAMAVYSSSDNTCTGTLTLIECDDDDSDNGSMPMIESFNYVPGSTIFVRFWEYSNDVSGTFGICATNIPCTVPTSVASNSLTGFSANVTWTGTGNYILEYGPTGFTPGTGATAGTGGTVITPATSPQTISGLTPSTAYQVYVRQDCTVSASGYSANSPVHSFTTTVACPAPTSVSTNTVTTASANVTWTGTGNFILEYGPTGFTPGAGATAGTGGTIINPATSPQAITGLSPATAYQVYVRQDCSASSNGFSNNSSVSSFTTLALPPVNDNCAGAINLTVNADYFCGITSSGTTVGATQSSETAPTVSPTGTNDDVWYTFTATNVSHRVSLSAVSGSTDMAMAIYSGSCGSLIHIQSSDPNEMNVTGLTPGSVYTVRVYTYVSSTTTTASFTICIGTQPPTPANDEATGAVSLTVNNDFNCGATTSGYTYSATASTDAAATCTGANDDVWYSFVATNTTHRVSFTGTSNTMVAALYTGVPPGALTFVTGACASTTLDATGLTVGTTYYVRAYTSSTTAGTASNFSICVGTPPPPPVNDNCAGAILLTVNPDYSCGSTTNGTTVSATQSTETAPTVNPTGTNDDVWYTFTATGTAHRISLTNVSGSTDMAMAIYSGACGALTHIQSSDPNDMNVTGLTPGTIYTVRVYTYVSAATTSASFTICVGTPPPPPANDVCANAISLNSGSVINGSTVSATQSISANLCEGATSTTANDVWFSALAVSSGSFTVSATVTTGDIVLSAYGACDDAASLITCADALTAGTEVVTISSAVAGNTYYFRVFRYNNAEGLPFTIQASGTPLPVKLASFTGKNAGTINTLHWQTTEEKNFSHFELQRSKDGSKFDKIAEVSSNRNAMGSDYAYNDERPFEGKNFYRLNMVDVDGRSLISEVVELMVKAGTGLSVNVYPNPVSQQLNVEVAGKIDGNGKVIVTDIVGKTVRNINMTGNTAVVDMNNLPSGIYMIKYSDNSHSSVIKVTKD